MYKIHWLVIHCLQSLKKRKTLDLFKRDKYNTSAKLPFEALDKKQPKKYLLYFAMNYGRFRSDKLIRLIINICISCRFFFHLFHSKNFNNQKTKYFKLVKVNSCIYFLI